MRIQAGSAARPVTRGFGGVSGVKPAVASNACALRAFHRAASGPLEFVTSAVFCPALPFRSAPRRAPCSSATMPGLPPNSGGAEAAPGQGWTGRRPGRAWAAWRQAGRNCCPATTSSLQGESPMKPCPWETRSSWCEFGGVGPDGHLRPSSTPCAPSTSASRPSVIRLTPGAYSRQIRRYNAEDAAKVRDLFRPAQSLECDRAGSGRHLPGSDRRTTRKIHPSQIKALDHHYQRLLLRDTLWSVSCWPGCGSHANIKESDQRPFRNAPLKSATESAAFIPPAG